MLRRHSKNQPANRRGRWSRVLLGFLGLAVLAIVPATAEERWRAKVEVPAFSAQDGLRADGGFAVRGLAGSPGESGAALREVTSKRFFTSHLLPNVNRQLDGIAAKHPVSAPGENPALHMMFDDVTQAANDRVTRGFRRGVRDYLLETTSLNRLDTLVSMRRRSDRGQKASLSFGVRAVHGRPAIELRGRGEESSVRLSLGGDGLIRLGFRHSRAATTRLSAAYDIDSGDVLFGCRIGL